MILNGSTIKELIKKDILIKKGNLNNIHSSSYDLSMSKDIMKFKRKIKGISLIDVSAIENLYEKVDISTGYEFKPGECLLAVLDDEFNMPNDVSGVICGRTSFNRLGIFITIQHINPGFKGKLNITITNHSPNTYLLTPQMQIAQVVFGKMNESVSDELLYGNEKNSSYQNEEGLNGSKIYKDYIGKVVRHFKGNYYYIENICLDSETKEYVVVYRSLYNHIESNAWVRSAEMFFEEIDPNKKDNITHQQHRFEVVNDLIVDYTNR